MSNSTKKMDVEVVKTEWENGKQWVKVTLKQFRSFFPSFEDLYRIVRAISYCEDKKYPAGQGRQMVADFLYDCCFSEDYDELAQLYNIPIREGEEVIETNGASIPLP